MRIVLFAVPALLVAGCAAAQGAGRSDVLDPSAKSPPLQYRSAFEDYRPFADEEREDWRRANDEVREAAEQPSSKPQPGAPETSGHHGHGGHK